MQLNPGSELCLRLFLAFAIGTLLGTEREKHHKPAGIRTHALVCLGSALFTIIGIQGFDTPNADPTRIAAQIVSGVGFIGAGIIFKDRGDIRGITTAASIWLVAALGMSVGVGEYLLTGVATVLGFIGLKNKRIYEHVTNSRESGEKTVSDNEGIV